MQEITGDLFASLKADAICITTNGFVTRTGECTMGRGCAGEAANRWPGLQHLLGHKVRTYGNHVHQLTLDTVEGGGGLKYLPAAENHEDIGVWKKRFEQKDASFLKYYLEYHLVSFPVKPEIFVVQEDQSNVVSHMRKNRKFQPDCRAPGWGSVADRYLITRSAQELLRLTDVRKWKSVVIPRPGCGAGELGWATVGPILSAILDDRFYAITFR